MTAHNLRFGATAAVPRMNLSCEIELPFAAELFVEAAASPSRCVVVCKLSVRVVEKAVTSENYVQNETESRLRFCVGV
jgi:hypothetical protein